MHQLNNKKALGGPKPEHVVASKASSARGSRALLERVQQTIGNHGLLRRRGDVLQAKLRIGAPHDKYEQEADRVADAVTQMPESKVQLQSKEQEDEEWIQTKPFALPITAPNQRSEESEEEEKKALIQPKTTSSQAPTITTFLSAQICSIRGKGQPLPQPSRAFFEQRFGYDFSQVRFHNGVRAAESARALDARAFTIGQDIIFGAGQYTPETAAGKRLLAHELVHVVQQADNSLERSNIVARQRRLDIERSSVVGVKRPTGYEDITTPMEALANEVAQRIFIPVWNNGKLVQEAKTKDIYLRHYSNDLGPEVQSEIAKTLILMFEEMDKRVKAPPLKLGPNGIVLPPEGTKWSSENLAGITTAISPFHMIDWWGLYTGTSSHVSKARKKKPSKVKGEPPSARKQKDVELPSDIDKPLTEKTKEAQKRERERAKQADTTSTVVSIVDLLTGIIAGIVGGIILNVASVALTALGLLLALADNSARQKHYSKIIALDLGLSVANLMASDSAPKLPARIHFKDLEREIKTHYRWRWYGQIKLGGPIGHSNRHAMREGLGVVASNINLAITKTEQKYRLYLVKSVAAKDVEVQYRKNIDYLRKRVVRQLVAGALPKVGKTLRQAEKKMHERK